MEVREQAAFSLWSLGGQIKSQQRYVAECFGTPHIITMLLSSSEKLQFVSLNAVIALADESESNQNRLYRENILTPLIRLLKLHHQLSHRVLLVLIQSFSVLCVGMFRKSRKKTFLFLLFKGFHLFQILCYKMLLWNKTLSN